LPRKPYTAVVVDDTVVVVVAARLTSVDSHASTRGCTFAVAAKLAWTTIVSTASSSGEASQPNEEREAPDLAF
jgi:hypothetical protein